MVYTAVSMMLKCAISIKYYNKNRRIVINIK